MVIVNKNEKETVIKTKRFAEILGNKHKAENIMSGEVDTDLSSIRVKGKTVTVLNVN